MSIGLSWVYAAYASTSSSVPRYSILWAFPMRFIFPFSLFISFYFMRFCISFTDGNRSFNSFGKSPDTLYSLTPIGLFTSLNEYSAWTNILPRDYFCFCIKTRRLRNCLFLPLFMRLPQIKKLSRPAYSGLKWIFLTQSLYNGVISGYGTLNQYKNHRRRRSNDTDYREKKILFQVPTEKPLFSFTNAFSISRSVISFSEGIKSKSCGSFIVWNANSLCYMGDLLHIF